LCAAGRARGAFAPVRYVERILGHLELDTAICRIGRWDEKTTISRKSHD
jgi:hypothetical protein